MKLTCYVVHDGGAEMVPGRPERGWMDEFSNRHPYRCLPLVVANTTGWELLSPVSFTASWNGGPLASDIRIDADGDTSAEMLDRWCVSHFAGGTITFHTGYLFRTDPGWDLWVGGPPNAIKDGIQPLIGVVETFWLPFPFTMNWRFTRPGMISFKKGEPFCFVMPVPHAAIDDVQPIFKKLASEPELMKEYEGWGESRTKFLENLRGRDPETIKQGWQRDYFKGQTPSGAPAPDGTHVNRRRLNPPRWAKDGE
ncbi:MAG: hypothetical protein GC206_03575 [Alphaproteobacteria bacterium]|nr:hypothetical protein [Alphaproteobacteria bacterium]